MVSVTGIPSKNNGQKKNLKKLIQIQCAVHLAIYGNPTPKVRFAIFTTLFFVVSYLALCYFTSHSFRISDIVDIVLIVSFFSYFMNRKPDSWVTVIDELLSEYDPLDKEEYIKLQTYIRDNGVDYHYIMEWTHRERQNYRKREKLDFTERNL